MPLNEWYLMIVSKEKFPIASCLHSLTNIIMNIEWNNQESFPLRIKHFIKNNALKVDMLSKPGSLTLAFSTWWTIDWQYSWVWIPGKIFPDLILDILDNCCEDKEPEWILENQVRASPMDKLDMSNLPLVLLSEQNNKDQRKVWCFEDQEANKIHYEYF